MLFEVFKVEYSLDDLKELIETEGKGEGKLDLFIGVLNNMMSVRNKFNNRVIKFGCLNLSTNIVFVLFIHSNYFLHMRLVATRKNT